MARRRQRKSGKIVRRLVAGAGCAFPAIYLLAALLGSLIPVNRAWQEPAQGITIYLADNGIHSDIIMPATAAGLDWRPLLPKGDIRRARCGSGRGSRSVRARNAFISKRRGGATSSPGQSGRRWPAAGA